MLEKLGQFSNVTMAVVVGGLSLAAQVRMTRESDMHEDDRREI